jgi:quercetin dioxygenase-like cupin family protein
MKRLVLACIFATALATLAFAADAPEVTVAPVITTDTTVIGQPIVMPEHPTVVVTIATFPPGSRLPVHKHLYPHYGYMLQGELTVTNEKTGKSMVLKKGDFLVEVNDTWHYGQNNGKEPVRVLIIDHLPKGVTSNVALRDAH